MKKGVYILRKLFGMLRKNCKMILEVARKLEYLGNFEKESLARRGGNFKGNIRKHRRKFGQIRKFCEVTFQIS